MKTTSLDGALEEPGARAPLEELDTNDTGPRWPWPDSPQRRSPFDWAHGRPAGNVDLAPGGEGGRGPGAWAGTRILEMGSGAAGPIATRYFGEHGATVIRIESSSRPDFLRVYGLRPGNPCGLDGAELFDSLNPQKLSVTLNLKHDEGVRLFRRLVSWADAVAENFAPRALRRLGLSYEELAIDKPDLVMVSSCIMGQTGPHRDYPGFGGQGSALAGYNFPHGLARP